MSGGMQAQPLCPRCYAQLAAGSTSCGRCGVAVDDRLPGRRRTHATGGADSHCPRCDRLETDGSRFSGAVGRGPAGACLHCGTALVNTAVDDRVAYEEVSRATDSWDLDRLARAEAVDGWMLLDTTVDPSAPNRLLAHFRRALPVDDPRARRILGGDAAMEQAPATVQMPLPAVAGSEGARPTPAARAATRPSPTPTRPSTVADPIADLKSQVRAAKAAAKEARKAGRQAGRSARRERRHGDWGLPAGAIAAVVLAFVGVGLTVGFAVIRLLVFPILLAMATVGRRVFLSLLHGVLAPHLRRGHRRAGWNGRW